MALAKEVLRTFWRSPQVVRARMTGRGRRHDVRGTGRTQADVLQDTLTDENGKVFKRGRFSNDPEGLKEFIEKIK